MHRRTRRFVGICVMALVVIPVYYYSRSYIVALELWDGDEVEERDCRECGGDGEDPTSEIFDPRGEFSDRCPFCRGTGKVEVILPGPNRPTKVRVLVLDGRRVRNDWTAFEQRRDPRTPFAKHPAAVQGATVAFESTEGATVRRETNGHGKCRARLAPGKYRYEIELLDGRRHEGEIEIEVLTAPIWLEHAKMVRPDAGEETRSSRGMSLQAIVGGEQPVARFQPCDPLEF